MSITFGGGGGGGDGFKSLGMDSERERERERETQKERADVLEQILRWIDRSLVAEIWEHGLETGAFRVLGLIGLLAGFQGLKV